MNLRVSISIDDVNPKPGWQILGTPVEGWLRSLNEEFGAKFTIFTPTNYHGEYPLSKHKNWVQEMSSIPWIELATHGHLHMTSDPKRFGECEFFELNREILKDRWTMMIDEWVLCEQYPKGFKPPGWLVNRDFNEWFNNVCPIHYISLNPNHNPYSNWNCKTFFGHDGIQETDIKIHNQYEEGNGMIMLTSHIAGDWNDNVWNQRNYDQLCISLDHLVQNYNCEFKTLEECL